MISELAAMASGHKCCAPSQWEASGRLLSGTMVSDGDGGQPLAYRGLVSFFSKIITVCFAGIPSV